MAQRMAGDTRLGPGHVAAASRQPLKEEERALVDRGYTLFEDFREKLREQHEQMRESRLMRQMKQAERAVAMAPGNTLNSCVDHAIADQIDNMPEAVLVPEREETMRSAEEMSDVVGYVLYQTGWAGKYQKLMEDAIVTGTGVAQVYWDDDLEDGQGMAGVLIWHPEDFYPDPMAEDIQDGRGCFKVTHTTVAWIEERYPHVRGYVEEERDAWSEGCFEAPEGDRSCELLEFWYKQYDAGSRRTTVHMAQFAGRALLYSTQTGYGVEGGKGAFKDGVYAHGKYPFTLYRYRTVWRRPFGSGLIDDYRETQNAIDRYQKYIDDNARLSSVQRHFIRRGSGISAEDVADMSRTIVEWEGNDIREVLQTVQAAPLNGQVYQMMQYLVDNMKQDCGQTQFNRGEGGGGVTAATAIQALQDAGGKIMRWHTAMFKESFREMIEQMLFVLSEYMEPGRTLRIVDGWETGDEMRERKVTLTAAGEKGLPRPAYTVRVQVQKSNPLQVQADNEFLLQVAQICAQGGKPLPPEAVIRLMEGYRTKQSVLRAIEESDQRDAQLEQLKEENERLSALLRAAQEGAI